MLIIKTGPSIDDIHILFLDNLVKDINLIPLDIRVLLHHCFLYRGELGLLTHNVIVQDSLQDSDPFESQGAD